MIPKFYNNFLPLSGDAFINEFQTFYKNNSNYANDLYSLLKNLTESSKNNIVNFLSLINTLPLPTKDFLIHKNRLFNESQLKQQLKENKFNETINQYYGEYSLQGSEKLTTNVFKYHMGLKFLPKDILKQIYNSIAIDIGAFWGDSALVISKYKPKNIYAFEPNSVNFKQLQNTIKSNDNLSITPVNMALGDKVGIEKINFISQYQNHGASLIYSANKSKSEIVNLTTLDTFLDNNNLEKKEKIGFIKIDTEGYGLFAIKGAINTIKNHKPIISVAIYHNPQEFFYIKPLLEQLNPTYKFMILELNQNDPLKDLTLLAF
jgi:FkbM family methyltransferase